MQRFAVLESNTGFVWGVIDAENALQACSALDAEIGDQSNAGHYEEVSASELRTSRGRYDVRLAPEGFNVQDGQDRDVIAAVGAMPRAGVFGWVETESWEAWLDGKREDAAAFTLPVGGVHNVVEAGAAALGVEVTEALNVART